MPTGARNSLILVILFVGALVIYYSRSGSDNVVVVANAPTAASSSNRAPPPPQSVAAAPAAAAADTDSRGRKINDMAPDDNTPAPPQQKLTAEAESSPAAPPKKVETTDRDDTIAAKETKKITFDDLMPDSRFDNENVCCKNLRKAANGLLGVSSDIGLLLPILGAYQREEDVNTVVELGSRLGSSSMTMLQQMSYKPEKRFATVDLEVRQPVHAMYRCEQICTDASPGLKGVRSFFSLEGNDLEVPIPFVTDKNKDTQPIDLLFIDTLHHAALLKMELKRYPKYVRKYMVFHDSYSFRNRNEGPRGFKPPGWPPGQSVPVGLQVVLREFLEDNKGEWIEEMNNVHNNGFFVIRRRSAEPAAKHWVLDVNYPRYSGIEMEPADQIEKILARGSHVESPEHKCNTAYDEMYRFLKMSKERISPPCHLAPGFSLRNHLSPLYNMLIAAPDKALPIAPFLPVIASQVTAPYTLNPDAEVVVMGCEASVANAALHGALQARKSNVRFFPSTELDLAVSGGACKTDTLLKYLKRSDAVIEKESKSFMKPKSIDVLVMSAEAARKLTGHDIFNIGEAVKHRIVVYGTNLFNIQKQAVEWLRGEQPKQGEPGNDPDPNGDFFELRLGMAKGVGMVMFERRFSTAYVYAPDARPKQTKKS